MLLLFTSLLSAVSGEREHKVHNIVLYPEKHSWCQITPIQQVVASPGYESVTIDNNVCVGACYSYSIPKTQPAEPGELIGPYCDSCQPSEMKCYHVNLHRSEKTIEGLKVMRKNVQIITNCSCQTCDKIRKDDCEINDENTSELPQNLFTDQKNGNKSNEEVPELLDVNNNPSKHHNENHAKFKNKLKKWFEISYQNDSDQVKSEDNYAKFSKELKDFSMNFQNEDSINDHNDEEYDRNDIIVEELTDPFISKSELSMNHPAYQTHTIKKIGEHHHHHLGDEEIMGMEVVHLVKGPHGSMVAAPVEAKFHIDSDALKPNSEGMIINYENHDHKKNEVPNL